MSLIRFRKLGPNQICIVSDTKFTVQDPLMIHQVKVGSEVQYFGGLKLIILTPSVCIGYVSNDISSIHASLSNVLSSVDLTNIDCILNHFLPATKGGITDLFVFIATHSGVVVKKLENGRAINVEDMNGYIGDFNAFQMLRSFELKIAPRIYEHNHSRVSTYFDSDELSSDKSTFATMKEMVEDFYDCFKRSFGGSTVGGFPIAVILSNGGFKYVAMAHISGPAMHTPSGNIFFGNAEHGSLIFSLTEETQIPLLKVYVDSSDLGLLYSPCIRGLYAQKFSRADLQKEFEIDASKIIQTLNRL